MLDGDLVELTSRQILRSFDSYISEFLEITRRAKWRFERWDWRGRHKDSIQRFDLYEKSVERLASHLGQSMQERLNDRETWTGVRAEYLNLLEERNDGEIAKSFFNSVTRKIFSTVGLDRNIEFFSPEPPPIPDTPCDNICRRYPESYRTVEIIGKILRDHELGVQFENIDRDAELVAREVDLYLWPILRFDNARVIEVIDPIFFRNKAAYIVGRILTQDRIVPLVLPMYNGNRGVYVDTVLLTEAEVSTVFSFAFSYFHINAVRKDALIKFLKSILPEKPLSELYTSIGFNKHGKTEFYRDLHKFIHESHEKFIIAPGKEGTVMIVFTLPNFKYVFKVIKDRPCYLRSREETLKTTTVEEVRDKYSLVCHRDRVGRMVDTQEFENLKFRRMRFSAKLLREFSSAAREMVTVDGESVVIKHVYVQRKVIPLPTYLLEEHDSEAIRRIIIDFGYFLKDLAATGIFPSDLFNTWNYGVTRRGRVVLFDYDDVLPLETINIREKPRPRDDEQEMELEENWVVAGSNDFFLDEIYKYTGIPEPLKEIFREIHGDLLTLEYWDDIRHRVHQGEIVDITPYDRAKRFANRPGYY
jgi:isocitrate dehydrogenase kinase/phosphatase